MENIIIRVDNYEVGENINIVYDGNIVKKIVKQVNLLKINLVKIIIIMTVKYKN